MQRSTRTDWIIGAITILIIVIVVALGRGPHEHRAEVTTLPMDLSDQKDSFAELQARDNELTTNPKTHVVRANGVLHANLSTGAALDFKDCVDCGPDKDVEHYLIEDSAHGIIIFRQYYEGDDFAFVGPDGIQHDLAGYPVFSPQGTSFVVLSESEMIGHSEVSVWNNVNKTPAQAFHNEVSLDSGYRFLKWENEDLIHLQQTQDSKDGTVCQDLDLVRTKETWTLTTLDTKINGACPEKQDWLPSYLQTSSM